MIEAINGVSESARLSEKYPIVFDPLKETPKAIARILLEKGNRNGIAPLVQVNMKIIYENKKSGNIVEIREDDLKNDSLIVDKTALLEYFLKDINIKGGFVNPVSNIEMLAALNHYIEQSPTSKINKDKKFYKHPTDEENDRRKNIISALKKVYLISEVKNDKKKSRLTHDYLAPTIFNEYERVIKVNRSQFEFNFSKSADRLKLNIKKLDFFKAISIVKELVELNVNFESLTYDFFELFFFISNVTDFEKTKELFSYWEKSQLLLKSQSDKGRGLLFETSSGELQEWLRGIDEVFYESLVRKYFASCNANLAKVGDKFNIGITPVTWHQYAIYLYSINKPNSIHLRIPTNAYGFHPVVNISWIESIEYCNWLNESLGLEKVYLIDKENDSEKNIIKWWVQMKESNNGFRLPNSGEWLLAAQENIADYQFDYSGGNNLDVLGWYDENSVGILQEVKKKKPNSLGLYDMSGNVWEWCFDWYEKDKLTNEQDEIVYNSRVVRGGSFDAPKGACEVTYDEYGQSPDMPQGTIGFRIVSTIIK